MMLGLHGSACADSAPLEIKRDEARYLVHNALRKYGPEINLDDETRNDDPTFYFFGATWPNPNGSPVIGYFAVNPSTGDIWDEGCHPVQSPSVKKIQSDIRARFNLSSTAFKILHAKKPIC